MTPCQPLHDYFEKYGLNPQDVKRVIYQSAQEILDGSLLSEYISNPAAKMAELLRTNPRLPDSIKALGHPEFIAAYKEAGTILLTDWVTKHTPTHDQNYSFNRLFQLMYDPSNMTFSLHLTGIKIKILFQTILPYVYLQEEHASIPRLLRTIEPKIIHTRRGSFVTTNLIKASGIESSAASVDISGINVLSELKLPSVDQLTVGNLSVGQLALAGKPLISIQGKYNELRIGELIPNSDPTRKMLKDQKAGKRIFLPEREPRY